MMRAHLLSFPISANLSFPQGPSAQSTHPFGVCSPFTLISLPGYRDNKSTPLDI